MAPQIGRATSGHALSRPICAVRTPRTSSAKVLDHGAADLAAPTWQFEGMKRSGPRLPVVGNPVPCAATTDPDQVSQLRRIDCRSYDRCLDLAIDQDWSGFHCNQCRGYEAPTPEEQRRDYLGALTLLAKTQLLASLAMDDDVFVDETGNEDEDDDAQPFGGYGSGVPYDDEDQGEDDVGAVAPNGRTDDSSN
jgi:hypothetical protein